jgi:hypothetical protein
MTKFKTQKNAVMPREGDFSGLKQQLQNNFRNTRTDLDMLQDQIDTLTASIAASKKIEKRITISNNATDANRDIDFGVGWMYDSTGASILTLASVMVKQLDAAWAAGTAAGGLFTGSIAATTWYHCFVIRKSSDGTIDAGFDTSLTAANIPTGYAAYRHVGSIRTDGSSNIMRFIQHDNNIFWYTAVCDYTLANPGTSAVLAAVYGPPDSVCLINFSMSNAGADGIFYGLATSPYMADVAPSISINTISSRGGTSGSSVNTIKVKTDSSSRVRYRLSATGAAHIAYLRCEGWEID